MWLCTYIQFKTNLISHITYTLCYRYVKFTDMEDRNKIIDECINKIKEMIKPHCKDHTPYWGNCVSCGDTRNWDELPDPDDVIEALEELKTEG